MVRAYRAAPAFTDNMEVTWELGSRRQTNQMFVKIENPSIAYTESLVEAEPRMKRRVVNQDRCVSKLGQTTVHPADR